MRTNISLLGPLTLLVTMVLVGCQTAPKTPAARTDLVQDGQYALNQMIEEDPSIQDLLNRSAGYAIFPNAGKGAFIVGGGYGRGVVYSDGDVIGYADLTQLSAGPQVGGQAFSELLVFQNEAALDRFRNNQLTFQANASAVIVKAGAGATANFQEGVIAFMMPKAGAMAELSLAGQRFTYSSAANIGEATAEQRTMETAQPAAGTATETETRIETRTETQTETQVQPPAGTQTPTEAEPQQTETQQLETDRPLQEPQQTE